MNKKLLILFLGIFLLVGTFSFVSAISNFNISSSISPNPLFFVNGTSGDVSLVGNLLVEECFTVDGRFMFPGELLVEGYLYQDKLNHFLVSRKGYKEEDINNFNMYPVILGSLDAFSFLNSNGGFYNGF